MERKWDIIDTNSIYRYKKLEKIRLKNIEIIKKNSSEFFPFLKNAKFDGYWRTNRAIPITNNDQRLSEIITYKKNVNFITVFSGKVTTAVKIAKQINIGLKTGYFNSHIYV